MGRDWVAHGNKITGVNYKLAHQFHVKFSAKFIHGFLIYEFPLDDPRRLWLTHRG